MLPQTHQLTKYDVSHARNATIYKAIKDGSYGRKSSYLATARILAVLSTADAWCNSVALLLLSSPPAGHLVAVHGIA